MITTISKVVYILFLIDKGLKSEFDCGLQLLNKHLLIDLCQNNDELGDSVASTLLWQCANFMVAP